MESPVQGHWQPAKNFEDQFIQNARAYAEMKPMPMPHEDLGPYLNQYSEYDTMLQDSLTSSIQDLDIPYSNPATTPTPTQYNQMTITPATLAKYSKIMMMGGPDGADGLKMQMPTPESSPAKSSPESSSYHAPMTPYTDAEMGPYSTPSSNVPFKSYVNPMNGGLTVPRLGPYDDGSDAYFSSPEIPSPTLQGSGGGFGAVPGPISDTSSPYTASPAMFDSQDQAAGIAWQPVVTAPKDDESQLIIKSQQSSGKQSNRKSCLPPGKVDSYMAGLNCDGQFECLFPNCNKLFKRRYNVRSHIQTHLCDRPYSCEVCGSSFVRPHDLRRHEKCHQDERPFTCPCGKSFTRHDALQRHRMRLICSGGIEVPGRPRKVPAKRGRPRKNPLPHSSSSESDSDQQSPLTSPEQNQECFDPRDSLLQAPGSWR
uniref:ARAD1C37444p n=1 Tax=Blastobotrys adeninivorans TaxID=409370 RepID=A0A060T3Y6_BLAAD